MTDEVTNYAFQKSDSGKTTRRAFLLGAAAFGLAGCSASAGRMASVEDSSPSYISAYGPMPDEMFPLPAIDMKQVPPQFQRQMVAYNGAEPAGTLVVDPQNKFLYLVRGDGEALRYGIGVGRQGFSWSGNAKIGAKKPWPTWTPPSEMIERQPELEQYRNGMEPGLHNPLGARALYLYDNGRDTLYRIHGTSEPWSIGKAVSSGCIRMFNQDVIDLYNRVNTGSNVVVLQSVSTVS